VKIIMPNAQRTYKPFSNRIKDKKKKLIIWKRILKAYV